MMPFAHNRHDLSNEIWLKIVDKLPGGMGKVGRRATDNRLFINAVLWDTSNWSAMAGSSADYGDWKNTHRRFCRWRD